MLILLGILINYLTTRDKSCIIMVQVNSLLDKGNNSVKSEYNSIISKSRIGYMGYLRRKRHLLKL